MRKMRFGLIFVSILLCFFTACGFVSKPDDAEETQTLRLIGSVIFEVNAKNAVAYGKNGLPANGALFSAQEVSLYEGESVMDILERILPGAVDNRGGYVAEILGLREKSCGATSGWYYYVNGEAPLISASKLYPKNNDSLRFLFTVSPGDIPYD